MKKPLIFKAIVFCVKAVFSSCPVYEVNKDFLGPYVLTRVLRYVNDKEKNILEKLAAIQSNGIWDCTLCGNWPPWFAHNLLTLKTDILNLREKVIKMVIPT